MSICNRLSLLVLPLFLLCGNPCAGAQPSSTDSVLEESNVETLVGPAFRAKDEKKKRKCCTGNAGKDGAPGPAGGPGTTGPTGPAGPETPASYGYYYSTVSQDVPDGNFVRFITTDTVSGGFGGSTDNNRVVSVPADGSYEVTVTLFCCPTAPVGCALNGSFRFGIADQVQPYDAHVPSSNGYVVLNGKFSMTAGSHIEVQYNAPAGGAAMTVSNASMTVDRLGPTAVSF